MEHIKLEKGQNKAFERLRKKDREFSELKAALKESKSSINLKLEDLSNKCEIMHKCYNDILIECNSNHSRKKFLKEN